MNARRLIMLTLAALALSVAPAAAAARASLTDIENDVMCVTCHIPLIEAQSPQAAEERDFIRGLIAQGQTKPQIERALVAQYGPAVLGKPPASGFDLTVYLLPGAIVALGLGLLAVIIPRWRRSSRAQAAQRGASARPVLVAADARRLDEDLARYDG